MLTVPRRAMSSLSPRPIVAVIGTTGVGKSQLAVSLAQSLRSLPSASSGASRGPRAESGAQGVVLSADSMQLYKGLDVITNKVTVEEMGGVEHWGLDVVGPGAGRSWDVGTWCNGANEKISQLPKETLPIICGGTHYFIQHFLFPPPELSFDRAEDASCDSTSIRWTPPSPRPPIPLDLDPASVALLDTFWLPEPAWPATPVSSASGTEQPGPSRSSRPKVRHDAHLLALHRVLERVDPQEAKRWHWRDDRKVRRGLERWWERGGAVQGDTPGDNGSLGRRARFRTLIFWVYEPLDTLKPRLDHRVDKMVTNGLLREITELRKLAETVYGSSATTDHSEGIFQAIGYKEFSALALPTADPSADAHYPSMLERTKLSTQQYAKAQLKWIKKQFLPAVREARSFGGSVDVYVVPGGEAGIASAREVMDTFLRGEEMPGSGEVGHGDAGALLACLGEASDVRVPDIAARQDMHAHKPCEVCSTPGNPYHVLARDWARHIKTKQHTRLARYVQMDKAEWIELQKAKGKAKHAERVKLKQELVELDALNDARFRGRHGVGGAGG